MAQKTNTAEGGSNGVTVTTGNSGGASGDAWDAVQIGASAGLTYTTAEKANGSVGYSMSTAGTSTTCYLRWTGFNLARVFMRAYVKYDAAPVSGSNILLARGGGSQVFNLRCNASGGFTLKLPGGGDVAGSPSASTIPTGAWFRIECDVTVGTSAAWEYKYFASPDSTTATETKSGTANFGTTNVADLSFGNSAANANWQAYMDALGYSDAAYLGPEVTQIAASDTATGTDAVATLVAAIASNQAATGTDVATLAAAVSSDQAATGTDAATLAAALGASDTGTGVDAESVLASSVGKDGADTATATGAESVTAAIAAADTATATDAASVEATAPTYTFAPPTVEQGLETSNPLFRYYRLKRGVSVLVSGSTVTQAQYPDQDAVAAADFAYLGGHVHVISAAEAATLTSAGYGSYITLS